MHCIPCMRCLICVSLGDVWGTVSITHSSSPTADLSLTVFDPEASQYSRSVIICDDKLSTCEDPYRLKLHKRQAGSGKFIFVHGRARGE